MGYSTEEDSDELVGGYDLGSEKWVTANRVKRNKKKKPKSEAGFQRDVATPLNENEEMTNTVETVPKSIAEPISSQPESTAQPPALTLDQPPQPTLDELIPANATSAERKRLIAESDGVFSGRYDPAAVRCVMSSMDECDLRELRDHLHAALPAAIPAVGGRPLCRRIAGNLPGLVEDCWALGYSAAQGVLTQRANTATLRPAGRIPLPPPAPSSDSAASPSSITTSLEAIISTQLRLEREVRELRTRQATRDACGDRLQRLEIEVACLREECDAKDVKIEQLKLLVEDLLAREDLRPARPVTPEPEPVRRADAAEPASGAAAAAGETQTGRNAAREIAAGLDLRALGEAIASALHWRAGESESEPERPPAHAGRCLGTAQFPDRCGATQTSAAPSSSAPVGDPGELTRQRNVVTGSGPPSVLIQDTSVPQVSRKENFILEGIRMDATDRDVRNLVWGVVRNLHDFQRLPSRGSATSATRAFRIEVDADDADRVLDPSSWPAGLVVRRRSRGANSGRRGRYFRRSGAAYERSQPSQHNTSRAEQDDATWEATVPRRHSDPYQGSGHDEATQYRDGNPSWDGAASRRFGGQNRDTAHDTGASWAAVASRPGGGDTPPGDGGREAAAPYRDGSSAHARYQGWHYQPQRGDSWWEECPGDGNRGAATSRQRRRGRRNGAGQARGY